jgi:hypothetical protein
LAIVSEPVSGEASVSSEVDSGHDDIPQQTASLLFNRIQRQAQTCRRPTTGSKLAAEKLFGTSDVALQLSTNVIILRTWALDRSLAVGSVMTVKEGPEDELSNIVASDIFKGSTEEPLAQIFFCIWDVDSALLEKLFALGPRQGCGMLGVILDPVKVSTIKENVE